MCDPEPMARGGAAGTLEVPIARPPAAAIAWVERTIGRRARVVAWRRLTGGLTSLVHRLTVERGAVRRPYILRRWGSAPEHEAYVRGAVASESSVLTALAAT